MASTFGDLSGKVLFVTGAGRGIGRGIAEVAVEAGAKVAINALTPQYVEDVVRRLNGDSPGCAISVVGDVTSPAGANAAVARVIEGFGTVDILVNCLGDTRGKPLVKLPGDAREAMTDAEVQEVLDLNLGSALACTRAVGPYLIAKGSGRIINISSFAAARRGAGILVYATAKTALLGLTRALALEWAPFNITVNSVAPGSFPDPVTQGERYQESANRIAARVPLGRPGEIREVGYAVRFFASEDASYITGQTVFVDGGATLG